MSFPNRKYHNKQIKNEYGKFDSMKEFKRYLVLAKLETVGEIKNLQRQVTYELIPSTKLKEKRRNGTNTGWSYTESACRYKADFVYEDANGNTIVEDVKGMRTKEYVIKRKLMLYRFGIQIREV